MKEIKLTIKGKAVPNNTKHRVFVNPVTGQPFSISYKPPKVKAYKELIQLSVTEYCLSHSSFKPFETPVEMILGIYLCPPRSTGKKKREEFLRGAGAYIGKRPDSINLTKLIEDAISKDAWNKGHHLIKNDSLIARHVIERRYAPEDYIEITLRSLIKTEQYNK